MPELVLIRGGGDLATGVALRLFRAGFRPIITELPRPLAVRRSVSFAEAVYAGVIEVEKVRARRAEAPEAVASILGQGEIPVLVDPEAALFHDRAALGLDIRTLVDARLTKRPPDRLPLAPLGDSPQPQDVSAGGDPLLIGLGPGFTAGLNCSAVVETVRGHTMGRVYWQGSALADTNLPEGDPRRVLRAPAPGTFIPHAEIAQHVEAGQILAEIRDSSGGLQPLTSPFAGVLRGILHAGLEVPAGLKVGDVDPRNDPALCYLVSDKSLAVGGGVLEAILAARAAERAPGS